MKTIIAVVLGGFFYTLNTVLCLKYCEKMIEKCYKALGVDLNNTIE